MIEGFPFKSGALPGIQSNRDQMVTSKHATTTEDFDNVIEYFITLLPGPISRLDDTTLLTRQSDPSKTQTTSISLQSLQDQNALRKSLLDNADLDPSLLLDSIQYIQNSSDIINHQILENQTENTSLIRQDTPDTLEGTHPLIDRDTKACNTCLSGVIVSDTIEQGDSGPTPESPFSQANSDPNVENTQSNIPFPPTVKPDTTPPLFNTDSLYSDLYHQVTSSANSGRQESTELTQVDVETITPETHVEIATGQFVDPSQPLVDDSVSFQEIIGHINNQLYISDSHDRRLTIRINPTDLGLIKITFAHKSTGLHVQITADSSVIPLIHERLTDLFHSSSNHVIEIIEQEIVTDAQQQTGFVNQGEQDQSGLPNHKNTRDHEYQIDPSLQNGLNPGKRIIENHAEGFLA